MRVFTDAELRELDLAAQVAEIRRELEMRRQLYPRFVREGKLSGAEASRRLHRLEAALETLMNASGVRVRGWASPRRRDAVADPGPLLAGNAEEEFRRLLGEASVEFGRLFAEQGANLFSNPAGWPMDEIAFEREVSLPGGEVVLLRAALTRGDALGART